MKEQCEQRLKNADSKCPPQKCVDGDNNTVEKKPEVRQQKANTNLSAQCVVHGNALLYCKDCLDIICGQCEKIHVSHQKMKLVDSSKVAKAKMAKETKHLKTLIRYANVVIKDLNCYLEKQKLHFLDISNEIMERANRLPEGTEHLSHSLLDDIQAEHDSETNRIKNKIAEFNNFIAEAKLLVTNGENIGNSVDEAFLTVQSGAFLKNAASLTLPAPPKECNLYVLTPIITPSDGSALSPEQMIGEFSKIHVPWRIEVQRTASIRPETISARFVTTMCPANDGMVWVVWQWGPEIHLVDKNGDVKKTINANCKVDDICTYKDTLVISSHESKSIKFLNENHEVVKTIEMDRVPRGTTFTSPNEVVTCCVQNLHHKNGDKSSMVCTNIDTGAQHELPCSEHLLQPWRLGVNVNGDICVSDRNKGSIMIFDHEGNLKSSYSGPDTTTRHPLAPHAVVCDRYGQILVVDYTNHTVHVLDPIGRFRGFLIMDTELEKRAVFMGTSSPFSITIDSEGDVWVGNKFGFLTVLKLRV